MLDPGFRYHRIEVVLFGQDIQEFGVQTLQNPLKILIEPIIPTTVDFVVFKQEEQFLEVGHGQSAVHRPQGMGQRVGDALLTQVVH